MNSPLQKIKFMKADAGSSNEQSYDNDKYTHIYNCNIAFDEKQKVIIA